MTKTIIVISALITAFTMSAGAGVIERVQRSHRKQYSTYQLLKANDCLDSEGALVGASDMCMQLAFPEKGVF